MKNRNEYFKKDFETDEELIKYSKQIEEKSLRIFYDKYIDKDMAIFEENSYGGKGGLGQNIEKYFFGYAPNSNKNADFLELGRELKVVPLKEVKKKKDSPEIRIRKGLSVKERMVITIIDYFSLVNESWTENTMKNKIKLLLMFYLYEKDSESLDYIFKIVDLWEPSKEDMRIIEQDWKKIQTKVLRGEAHNLSEGDTLYLGACTKGANSNSVRSQPYSEIVAKQRAFSFKSSYMNIVLNELLERKSGEKSSSKFFKLLSDMDSDLETKINSIFLKYKNKTIREICIEKNIQERESKDFYRRVISKVLVGDENAIIEEIEKAGIKMKVIRVDNKGKIPEHISFPAFDFIDLSNEEWEESELRNMLEVTKFMFVILKKDCTNSEFKKLSGEEKNKHLRLENIILWNMPINDIEGSAKKVWEKTKKVILEGIPTEIKGKVRTNSFPKAKEFGVMHVRPHARDTEDTKPLPNGEKFTKQCFWLNKEYIQDIIK